MIIANDGALMITNEIVVNNDFQIINKVIISNDNIINNQEISSIRIYSTNFLFHCYSNWKYCGGRSSPPHSCPVENFHEAR